MQPILPVVSSPRVLLSSTAPPSRKQTTNQTPSHIGNNTSSPARPGPVGPLLRSATSTFITQLTTEHSRSISTVRGPLSVSYKGERGRREKRELRSRIRVPTRQGPALTLSPNLSGRPNHKYPDCLGLPGQSSRHDPQSRATPHSQPRYSVTSTLSFPARRFHPRFASAPALLDMRMPMRIQSR